MNAEAAAELDRQLVAIMVSAGRSCTAEQATAIRVKILGRKRLDNPAAYVASVVRRDPAAAFALLLAPRSVNGHGQQPPPSAEVLAVRATIDPEVAKRGAALARKLLDGRPAAGKVPPPDPEEFPF
jgi:hypothetical protein